MLHSLNPLNNLPFSFVGRGRQKAVELTKVRKEERNLMQEIDSVAPEIDELGGDMQSTDSNDTSMDTQPATSDSIDCSLIDTASDGKSLPSHPFSDFMSKGYAVIRRKLKADPQNPQRMHSRKLQYHFSQAYSPTKAPAQLSSASTGAVCCVGPSTDHDLSTKVKTHLHITEDDIPAAVSELPGHPTKCKVHVPDDDDDDSVPCKTFRCPRCYTSNHSVADDALDLNTTARETHETKNGQIVDSAGEEEFCFHKIFRFPHGFTSAPSNTKTPSASKGELKRADARLTNDVEKGTGIRMTSCSNQTPVGGTSTDAGATVSPNAAPFPLRAVVDSARLPAAPIEHLGPSTESVAFDSPFVACQVEERHVALSSSLIPSLPVLPSTTVHDLYLATDGSNLLENNDISSLTSIFPTPVVNIPSYGAALDSQPLAFPHLPDQVLFAEQPVSTFLGPSLSATTYDGFTAEPFFSGPFTSNSLDISSDYASFVNNGAVRANEGPLPQPQWINHFDRIDVEMADAVIRPTTSILEPCFVKLSAKLNAPTPFLDFPLLDITTAIHYAYTYEPPAAITVSGGVSTAASVSAVGPSSEDFSTIVEPSYSKPAFDFPTDIGPSAIQSWIGHSSRWSSSSILEAHLALSSAPIPERPTDFFGSRITYLCSDPSEIPSAEQNVYEVSSRERQIQGTCGRANYLYISLENEHSQHASSAVLKVNVHEYIASKSVPTQNAVIHEETILQPAGYVNDAIAPVRHQPQYIAPSAANITGRYSDEKETQAEVDTKTEPDDDAKTEPDDDAKTEPDDDAKTEPDDGINEKDVNAEVLAHAILDIPLPPPIVASVQFLGQRKRRNSCCREGITRMRVKRRQMNIEESEEDGDGGILAHRTRFNHLTRPSPYGLVPRRREGHAKGHER